MKDLVINNTREKTDEGVDTGSEGTADAVTTANQEIKKDCEKSKPKVQGGFLRNLLNNSDRF